jgi:hypothetical protein
VTECDSCGHRLPPAAAHCPSCGQALPAEERPAPAPVGEPAPPPPSPVMFGVILALFVVLAIGTFLFMNQRREVAKREFNVRQERLRTQERRGECRTCSGSGSISISHSPDGPEQHVICRTCNGSGFSK